MTRVEPAGALVGHIAVPGDKSITHRVLLIGAISDGETRVHGFGRSGDTESTLAAVRSLGIDVDERGDDELVVHGRPEACRERIEQYRASGLGTPVVAVVPAHGMDEADAVRRLAPAG